MYREGAVLLEKVEKYNLDCVQNYALNTLHIVNVMYSCIQTIQHLAM